MELENYIKYSGLTKRISSFLVDIIVLIIINTIFTLLVSSVIYYLNKEIDANSFEVLSRIIIYCAIISYLMYFSILDSNLSDGTIGKRVFKVVVVNKNNNKIGFLQAFVRAIIKYISIFGLFGFILVVFTKKKQALHDIALNTFVIIRQ